MTFTGYTVAHGNSTRVLPHLARGGRFPVVPLPGDQAIELHDGGMVTYGEERGLRLMLDRAMAQGREWVYIDNGYFKWGHFAGYYRVTRNRYMHDGVGSSDGRRWKALGLRVKPWARGGSFIVVCPPPQRFATLRKFDAAAWLDSTLAILRANTDREIRVREKMAKREIRRNPLERAIAGAHALVCHSSNAAAEALLEGIPVFCTSPCASSMLAESDLSRIESPRYPDGREEWARVLADNQWTLDEMRSGLCWRALLGAA